MRVRLDDGRIVVLAHFKCWRAHVHILQDLKIEVENLLLQCSPDEGGQTFMLPAYRFNFDMQRLRELNPDLH